MILLVLRSLVEFQPVMEMVGKTVDAVGVAVIVLGAIVVTGSAARRLRRGEPSYQPYRRQIGRSILLGLEFLVAADIIRTGRWLRLSPASVCSPSLC